MSEAAPAGRRSARMLYTILPAGFVTRPRSVSCTVGTRPHLGSVGRLSRTSPTPSPACCARQGGRGEDRETRGRRPPRDRRAGANGGRHRRADARVRPDAARKPTTTPRTSAPQSAAGTRAEAEEDARQILAGAGAGPRRAAARRWRGGSRARCEEHKHLRDDVRALEERRTGYSTTCAIWRPSSRTSSPTMGPMASLQDARGRPDQLSDAADELRSLCSATSRPGSPSSPWRPTASSSA